MMGLHHQLHFCPRGCGLPPHPGTAIPSPLSLTYDAHSYIPHNSQEEEHTANDICAASVEEETDQRGSAGALDIMDPARLVPTSTLRHQLWPTLWDPVDCSPPGSSVHVIFQARIQE